jgi:hypothetical protein
LKTDSFYVDSIHECQTIIFNDLNNGVDTTVVDKSGKGVEMWYLVKQIDTEEVSIYYLFCTKVRGVNEVFFQLYDEADHPLSYSVPKKFLIGSTNTNESPVDWRNWVRKQKKNAVENSHRVSGLLSGDKIVMDGEVFECILRSLRKWSLKSLKNGKTVEFTKV